MTCTALKATILGAAVTLARKNGLHRLTRLDIATSAECGTGTVSYHFGDMDGVTNAVVEYAVQHEVLEILAQARVEKHAALGRMSADLKARVAAYIVR